jgi:hypothetical protein
MPDFEKALLLDYMDKDKKYRLSYFRRWPLVISYTPEFRSIANSIIFLAVQTYGE